MRLFFCLYLLLIINIHSFSQNQAKIDSLQMILEGDISDKKRVDIYVSISSEYKLSDSANTLKYANKAISVAKKINYPEGKIDALYQIGLVYLRIGYYSEAKVFLEQVVQESQITGYLLGKVYGLKDLGVLNNYQGNYQQSMEYYFEALELVKKLEDEKVLGDLFNNIGNVYENREDYEQALQYYFQALEVAVKTNNQLTISATYNNIALIYDIQGKYEQALDYFLKSLEIDTKLEDKVGMSTVLGNIGNTYQEQGDYEHALEYYFKSLEISESIGDQEGISYSLLGLGEVYILQRQWLLAKKNLIDAFLVTKEIGLLENIREITKQLAIVEKELGNYQAAFEYQVLFKEMADSLKNEEQTEQITRLEMNYEFQQEKDSIQLVNETDRIAFEKDIETRNVILIAVCIGLVLTFALVIILFLFFRNQRKNNRELNNANEELKHYNKELQSANEIIFETNRKNQKINEQLNASNVVILKAHEKNKKINKELQNTLSLVKQQQEEIWESISYAERIQQVILPLDQVIQETFSQHFILFKPRDVVSGDFYWYGKSEMAPIFEEKQTTSGRQRIFKGFSSEKYIIAAVDCTGHGVPGAFMSLIGNNLLNAIINERGVYQVDEILNILHQEIRRILKQEKTDNIDGMDISIACIDFENQQLEFAGAKNPLIYIQEGKLHQVKGDIIGIGGERGTNVQESFTLNVIDISKPTTFYLFSDGYQDQFGGKRGKKFMTKRFRELLFEIHKKPMHEQKMILEETLTNWMGKEEQVDDILVIGVSV